MCFVISFTLTSCYTGKNNTVVILKKKELKDLKIDSLKHQLPKVSITKKFPTSILDSLIDDLSNQALENERYPFIGKITWSDDSILLININTSHINYNYKYDSITFYNFAFRGVEGVFVYKSTPFLVYGVSESNNSKDLFLLENKEQVFYTLNMSLNNGYFFNRTITLTRIYQLTDNYKFEFKDEKFMRW